VRVGMYVFLQHNILRTMTGIQDGVCICTLLSTH